MDKVEKKKQAAIQNIAQYLLVHGLHEIGIRRLAEVAGTSDRMLIYYFGTKDELMNQVLGGIAGGVTEQLDVLIGVDRRPAVQLMEELTALFVQPVFTPSLQLWFELVGLAVRGKEPYASNAWLFASNWIEWIASRLDSESELEAADLYAHLEGRLMVKLLRESGEKA